MRLVRHAFAPFFFASLVPWFSACSSDDQAPSGGSGASAGATGGSGGGSAGTSTTGGTGTGGSAAGMPGAGTGGSAAGSGAASAGRGGAGAAGTGGSAGSNVGGAGISGSAGAGSGGAPGGGAGGAAGAAGGIAGGMSGGAGSGSGGRGGAGGSTSGGTFTVTNPDFMNVAGCSDTMQSVCDTFPPELASYMTGSNISPELDWTGVPAGTKSFAVLLQDLSNGYAHWAIWNIPGTATMLAADVPKTSNMPAMPTGSQQANASFASGDGYFGPGSACNVYEYVVFALAMEKFTPTSTTDVEAVRTALKALDDTELLGTTSIRGRQAACSGNQTCNADDMCAN